MILCVDENKLIHSLHRLDVLLIILALCRQFEKELRLQGIAKSYTA